MKLYNLMSIDELLYEVEPVALQMELQKKFDALEAERDDAVEEQNSLQEELADKEEVIRDTERELESAKMEVERLEALEDADED